MIYFYVKITFAKREGFGSRKSTVIRLEYFGGKEIQAYASNGKTCLKTCVSLELPIRATKG